MISRLYLKMAADSSGEDLKSKTNSLMDTSKGSRPHADTAGLSDYSRPITMQPVSSSPNNNGKLRASQSIDYQSPQNATDLSATQELHRTEHSVAISDSTRNLKTELSPALVQGTIGRKKSAIAPAHTDDTALDPIVLPSGRLIEKTPPTKKLMSDRTPPTPLFGSMNPPSGSWLSGIRRKFPGKPASSDDDLPLSQRRTRRPLMPTAKMKIPDPSPPKKRKVSDGPPKLAVKKRQRTSRDLSTNPTDAYGTSRPTAKPTDLQPSASATQSMTQSVRPMPELSAYKQDHTTLLVSVTTYIYASILPIKLRSCMTMETFFSSILNATRDTVNKGVSSSDILVSFNWKDANDRGRSMLLRKDTMDTYQVFLETIDEAPCWDHMNGRCEIAVDVV